MSYAPDNATDAAIDTAIGEILAMLAYRRPMGSVSEAEFIDRFIGPLGPQEIAGNLMVRIPHPNGEHSRTMFSCHTDTVHREGGMQDVLFDSEIGWVYKGDHRPLGADDGAGCWLLLQLIKHGVPGTYMFHAGEECGGIGSGRMSTEEVAFLGQFDRAIAFDRKSTTDVITHQRGERCASQDFAKALAEALNTADQTFAYEPCSSGVFTDTANYTEIIPECTNLSVGYEDEHTGDEMLDMQHLLQLAAAIVKIDWDSLPTKRDPKVIESKWGKYSYGLGWDDDYRYSAKPVRVPRTPQEFLAEAEGHLRDLAAERAQEKARSAAKFGRLSDDPTWLDPWDDDEADEDKVITLFEGGRRVERDRLLTNEEAQHFDVYEEAERMASEFFSLCLAHNLNRAYTGLRTDEVVDFWLSDEDSFTYLLAEIEAGYVDDEEAMIWVKGL